MCRKIIRKINDFGATGVPKSIKMARDEEGGGARDEEGARANEQKRRCARNLNDAVNPLTRAE